MPIVSYAQNFEDVLLWRALQNVKAGVYIDIGAQHPIFDSVSRGFYERGWRGIHVEPSIQYSELLRGDRPDETVIHAAVSDRAGMLRFFEIPDTGLSTATTEIAETHRQRGWKVTETLVTAVTLDQVFASVRREEIHWLKIDVEGFERAALKGWRRSKCRPWIIVVEAVSPLTAKENYKEWEPLLIAKGYSFVHFDGLNRFYLSSAHRDLKKHFRYGPSLWDDFQIPEGSRPANSVVHRHKEALDRFRAESEASLVELNNALSSSQVALEQKRAELGQAHGVLDKMRGELEQKRGELSQAHGVLDRTRSELEQKQAELGQAHGDLDKVRGELEQKRGELSQAHGVLDQTRSELEQKQAELGQAHGVLDKVHGELEQKRGELSQAHGVLDRTRSELEQKQSELGRANDVLDNTRVELEQARADLAQALLQLADMRSELNQAQGELSQTRGALEQTRDTLDQTRAELSETRGELKQSRGELYQTRGDLDRTRGALDQARSELVRMREVFERAQSGLEQARVESGQTRAELDQMRSALDRALDELGRTNSTLDQARSELEQARGEHSQTRGELSQTRDALDRLGAEAHRQGERWSRQRARLMAELAAISGSFWWRLSVPFRRSPASLAVLAAEISTDREVGVDGDTSPPAAGSADELLNHDGEGFVRCAYATLMGRQPDPQELRDALGQLMVGASRETILVGLSVSEEGRRFGAELQGLAGLLRRHRRLKRPMVGAVFRALGGTSESRRAPWLSSGPVTGTGRDRIALSVEELLSLQDESFVRCTYATVLGREPDPDGLHHYLARVRNGESRRAILAEIRLSPEGQEREELLPGLDRAIRPYRLRRLPLIGPIVRLSGGVDEAVDVQSKLAAIESQLDLLTRLAPPVGVAVQPVEQQLVAPPMPVESSPAPSVPSPPEAATRERVVAEVTQARLREAVWTAPLTWRIGGTSDRSKKSSLVRVELARALAELGHEVAAGSSRVDADVTALVASPPLSIELIAGSTLLVGFDWEESGYPVRWIDAFNDKLSGVACATSHAQKILIDHGLSVPTAAVGLGVDHWDRLSSNPDYRAPGKSLRFLHVSSCGLSSGIDLLFEAFYRVFDGADDVSLIVHPLGVPCQESLARLDELRTSNPDGPDIVVVQEDLSNADLKALYEQCQVFVAPSRAEGFGLPLAQALLSGQPVVATAWGGHRDYCDETNSWLVDYRFQRARSPSGVFASVWAEPDVNSLEDALLKAFQATPAERFAKAWAGRKQLMERFTWKDVALRLAALAERAEIALTAEPVKSRVGWLTTWNVHCGIAGHVEHLLESMPADEYVIFAARQEPRIRPDDVPNCVRSWDLSKDPNNPNGLGEVTEEMTKWAVTALVIQHNYSFYCHRELSDFIEAAAARGIVLFVELHSVRDPFGDTENWRLSDFIGGLRKCHRILVHGPADMDRLKELGLVDNVMLMPHGVMNKRQNLALPAIRSKPPLIASFGFCFPNKGLLELVEAVSLLKRQGTPVRLRMVNAVAPHPFSAPVAEQIKATITRLGLEDDVETYFEFLEDAACLALLGEADLLVNPYQNTGESASGAVRYGLSSGRPIAVTPLSIFDDLGDAVFRMPGTTPQEMAQGIAAALEHLEDDTEIARGIRESALRWMEEHDYSRHIDRLMRMIPALAPHETAQSDVRTRPKRRAKRGTGRPAKLARGIFINTASASCSIFESGRMVYNSIKESDCYTLEYFSLDMLDVAALANEGRIVPLDRLQGASVAGDYDFWVFNWHFITMAPHLDNDSIRRLPGRKFTVVLELEPDDPLKLVPRDVFDGFIALDPAAPEVDNIFAFPRPLEGEPRRAISASRDIPVIGSFGFGTPGKGFELLVAAVNQAFERAVVRINVPSGTYTGSTDVIHWQEYPKYLAALCKRIAKPGIEVRFTHEYMTPEQLLDWCSENDLNCFMYTRRQSGLSATTDQAIMSGRPLLTLSNDTFRHIHRYIPPYPVIGLREAIETTVPSVRRIQRDWSRASFGATFERMLASFGLIAADDARRGAPARQFGSRACIMVVSQPRSNPHDIVWYSTRVADALRRTTKHQVLSVQCSDLAELRDLIEKNQPSAVVVMNLSGVEQAALEAALNEFGGTKILLACDLRDPAANSDSLHVLQRKPIVPFFTSSAGLRTGAPAMWLVGFSTPASNLEEVVEKISRDCSEAVVLLEVPENVRPAFEIRVAHLRESLPEGSGVQLEVHGFPATGESVIANFVVNHLSIFYNDPARSEELESISCLAMTTERAVAFTRAAPFPDFLDGGTYVEDLAIADIIGMGMAAQIRLCHDFGEWQCYARIDRLMAEKERA